MRKVELKEQEEKVKLSELNQHMLIGVRYSSSRRGFVTKVNSHCYISVTVEPNTYQSKVMGTSIQDLINQCDSIVEIVVADTRKELFEWLMEGK
jgi:hypothetical protein